MTIINKDLKRRIIELSHKYNLSHLGSGLSAVDILDEIYAKKKANEKFVLSSGHAGLALYVVLEKYQGVSAEVAFLHHGVHPDRCRSCGLDCSSGSLGNGLPIAVGMALADRSKDVYCLISDGECAEGSVWEALRIKADLPLPNLHIYVNVNGYSALSALNTDKLMNRLHAFGAPTVRLTSVEALPFLKGISAHYYIMGEKDYKQALGVLK